jgi:hypothetical protein
LDFKEWLITEVKGEQRSLIESVTHQPAPDYASYREVLGEIKGLQRVVRLLEDLPDE